VRPAFNSYRPAARRIFKGMKKISFLLAVSLLAASCNRDKNAEAGTQGMNAAAADADAKANPTIDNPNVASDTEAPNPDAPVMTFAESQFDFGDIKPGAKVQHTFTFTNTGKTPLLIADATASCGCTTPNWTKEPIAPGAKGTLDVQFDSQGKQGLISKQVNVRANTQPNMTVIYIKGNVLTQ
jgi:hypothetical protein